MNRRTTEPAPWALPNSSNSYGAPNTVGGGVWLSLFNFRSSIQAQLTLSFIAVSAFVLIVISVFAASIAKDVIEDTVVDDLSAIASIQSAHVEQILGHTLENLEHITADSRVRNTLRHYIATNDHTDLVVLSQIISDRAASAENIESIDLFNLNGKLVLSSKFESIDRSHIDPRVEGFVFSSNNLGEDHYLSAIHISAPFVFDGNVVGYATVHSNTDELKKVTNTYSGLRESEEIVLLTNDSDGVGRFITPVRFGGENFN